MRSQLPFIAAAAGMGGESFTTLWTRTSPGEGEWDAYEVGSPAANLSPWGMGDAGPTGTMTATLEENSGGNRRHIVEWANLAMNSGLPKGAPGLLVGWHDYYDSDPNPFLTGTTRGLSTGTLATLTASTGWTEVSAPSGSSYLTAIQIYLYYAEYTGDAWGDSAGLDVQIRGIQENFPAPSVSDLVASEVAIGPHTFNIYRNPNSMGAGGFNYSLEPTAPSGVNTYTNLDLLAIIEWIRADNNTRASRTDPSYWMRAVQSWVEPRAGDGEVVINGLTVGAELEAAVLAAVGTSSAIAATIDTAAVTLAVGDRLIACLSHRRDATNRTHDSITSTGWAATWTKRPDQFQADTALTTSHRASMWDGVVTTAGTGAATGTLSGTAYSRVLILLRVPGMDAVDQQAAASNEAGTTVSAAWAATPAAGALGVAFMASEGAGATLAVTGLTAIADTALAPSSGHQVRCFQKLASLPDPLAGTGATNDKVKILTGLSVVSTLPSPFTADFSSDFGA